MALLWRKRCFWTPSGVLTARTLAVRLVRDCLIVARILRPVYADIILWMSARGEFWY